MPTDENFVKKNEDVSELSFVKEIRLMLYGLGDSRGPLSETADLLEEVILKQLVSVVVLARKVASMRHSEVPGPEDVLFLMRKNPPGLKRMISYLGVKDEKKMLNKVVGEVGEPDDEDFELGETKKGRSLSWKVNRKGYCLEVMRGLGLNESAIENCDDKVKSLRLARADITSQKIPKQGYQSYAGCRRASFGGTNRFIEWLRVRGGLTSGELPAPIVEVLQYLAKETLSQIVDMAFTLREQHSTRQIGDGGALTPQEVQDVLRLCWTPQSFKLGILTRDLPVDQIHSPLPLH